jgi:hypothetical protein
MAGLFFLIEHASKLAAFDLFDAPRFGGALYRPFGIAGAVALYAGQIVRSVW